MSSDIHFGNYEAMCIERKDDGLLHIVSPGTDHQVVAREVLIKMINDYNEQVTRVAIWKGKWEAAEQRYRDISNRYQEERTLRQTLENAAWGVEHP